MASQIVGSEKIPGSITVTRGSETQLTITEQYEFLVESDDKNATRQEIVFNTPGLPITGVLYVSNGLVCKSKRAERLAENPFYWKVVCEFESGREDQKQSTSQPDSNDPTTWVPVFVVDSFETKDRVLVKDKSTAQNPIVNRAGTRFETPLVEKIRLCSFSFVQFEDSSLTLKTIMDRNETINTSTLDVYAAKTLKLNVTEAALGYYAGVLCWRIAYKVTYDRDTWDTPLFNVGPFYKSGGTLLPYKYKGVQIVGNLEDDGTMRSMLSAPTTITFQDKRDIDFSFIRTS